MLDLVTGSSPHTRGARLREASAQGLHGIIPAYAGSTPRATQTLTTRWDHPRIRGEHVHRPNQRHGAWGSSPHTRGARHEVTRRRRPLGIIPAYAGSTLIPSACGVACWDHPRIRGEHWASSSSAILVQGSSPHTRGAQTQATQDTRTGGIIPAYAGSTSSGRPRRTARRDHPRIRGEHWPCEGQLEDEKGSSPHTRGAPRLRCGKA